MSKILGIDLGTTNSAMAVIEGGQPKIIEIRGETSGAFGEEARGDKSEEHHFFGKAPDWEKV